MRLYEKAFLQLLSKKKIRIIAPKESHARIRKAIVKEKWLHPLGERYHLFVEVDDKGMTMILKINTCSPWNLG